MSWARVDDGLWDHPKFEALREAGDHRALALWLLALSYCGRKQSPRISSREAAMLLCASDVDAESACECLASRGLLDAESASPVLGKQNRSYVVHDWEHYRSKNEAKVLAGRKGGKKSAESRRVKVEANPKQPDIMFQAAAKQEPTPDPVPDPGSVPDPDPIKGGEITAGAALGNELRKHGVRLAIGAESAFGKYLPCTSVQVAEAVRVTVERTGEPKAAYALSVLDGLRRKPPEAGQPKQAPTDPAIAERYSRRKDWLAIGKRHSIPSTLLREQEDQLAALAPSPEELEQACAAADEASTDRCAMWGDVIALLRSETTLRAVGAAP